MWLQRLRGIHNAHRKNRAKIQNEQIKIFQIHTPNLLNRYIFPEKIYPLVRLFNRKIRLNQGISFIKNHNRFKVNMRKSFQQNSLDLNHAIATIDNIID